MDTNVNHDHSFFGNGCVTTWDTTDPYYGGSLVACSSRIVNTVDDEPQSTGSFYSFQAATSGSGASVSADNAIASDTFCPLGWQLPYDGTGGDYYDKSKSWRFLFNKYGYSMQGGSAPMRSYPFSNILSGWYQFTVGAFQEMTKMGYWHSETVQSSGGVYDFRLDSIWRQHSHSKTAMTNIRCSLVLASFIDGTVAGTDVEQYKDDWTSRDHTYYGNGCNNPVDWENPPTYSGSAVSCQSRTVQTFDDETQLIGTYYHSQASNASSGRYIDTNNANAPDSFCPLGWQLPYDGTGGDYYNKSKSLDYLFNKYSITNTQQGSEKSRSYPIQFVHAGYYMTFIGLLFDQGNDTYYWSQTVFDAAQMYRLHIGPDYIVWGTISEKSQSYPVRCGVGLAT